MQLMVKRSGLAVEEFKEDATEFKPARWLESDGQPLKTSPRGFMPFGGVSYADLFLALPGTALTLHAQPCSTQTWEHGQFPVIGYLVGQGSASILLGKLWVAMPPPHPFLC